MAKVNVTHVHISIVRRILIRHVLGGHGNRLGNNYTNNQSVNTQNTRHDNGYNVTNDTSGVIHTHVTNAQSSTPSAPGRTPGRQNHANGGTHVTTVVVLVGKLHQSLIDSFAKAFVMSMKGENQNQRHFKKICEYCIMESTSAK